MNASHSESLRKITRSRSSLANNSSLITCRRSCTDPEHGKPAFADLSAVGLAKADSPILALRDWVSAVE
jgi:hypothetical protein